MVLTHQSGETIGIYFCWMYWTDYYRVSGLTECHILLLLHYNNIFFSCSYGNNTNQCIFIRSLVVIVVVVASFNLHWENIRVWCMHACCDEQTNKQTWNTGSSTYLLLKITAAAAAAALKKSLSSLGCKNYWIGWSGSCQGFVHGWMDAGRRRRCRQDLTTIFLVFWWTNVDRRRCYYYSSCMSHQTRN